MSKRGRNRSRKRVPLGAARIDQVQRIPKIAGAHEVEATGPPVWRVRKIDVDGPFGWEQLDKNGLLSKVLPRIQHFETMKWQEILGTQNHEVQIASLAPEAQKRLQFLQLDDIGQLLSLRLSARERVWGIRNRDVVDLLWWDPEHKVCPSEKKHT